MQTISFFILKASLKKPRLARSDRANVKSAAQLPTRNNGEIDDDEEEPPDMLSDSEDEDSDNDLLPGLESDSDSEWGDEALFFWEEDYQEAHDPAPVGPIDCLPSKVQSLAHTSQMLWIWIPMIPC